MPRAVAAASCPAPTCPSPPTLWVLTSHLNFLLTCPGTHTGVWHSQTLHSSDKGCLSLSSLLHLHLLPGQQGDPRKDHTQGQGHKNETRSLSEACRAARETVAPEPAQPAAPSVHHPRDNCRQASSFTSFISSTFFPLFFISFTFTSSFLSSPPFPSLSSCSLPLS